MISEKMRDLVRGSSAIRAMFEEGKQMAREYGAENVYDYSLGNPSAEPPKEIKEAILALLEKESPTELHGYMSNSGFEDVRAALAEEISRKHGTSLSERNILMTVGAAGGLNVILKTLLDPGDEVVVFAPFFGEYANYVRNYDGRLVTVPANTRDFQPDLEGLSRLLTARTKAVIVNTPNNPTGVVYSEDVIRELARRLGKAQEDFHSSIYLISDEPYRELVYDGAVVPYIPNYYGNTIVGYSYSKSLSLPGERIGYLVLPDSLEDGDQIREAANVANRILGFVNAPSLMQKVVARCPGAAVDVGIYDRNRMLLYETLTAYGYEMVKPQGAFYLFIKSLEEDDRAFVERAKARHILLVPGSTFGCAGYVRLAYCVEHDMIERSLPAFRALAAEYGRGPDARA